MKANPTDTDIEAFTFKVLEIVEVAETREARVVMEISDAFKKWFIEHHRMKRWSHKKFQSWFTEALSSYIENQKTTGGQKNVD